MATTLELFDGVTTLDLKGSVYTALIDTGVGIPRPPNVPTISANQLSAITFEPRTVTMRVKIKGTTQSDLETQIRTLERMVAVAQARQLIGESSTKVVLKYQLGDTNANDASLTVISGGFSPAPSSFDKARVDQFEINGTLTLICEPFGELADITMGRRKLFNEIDLPNINYVDIGDGWGGFHGFDGATTEIDCGSSSDLDDLWASGGHIGIRFEYGGASQNDLGDLISKSLIGEGWYFNVRDNDHATPAQFGFVVETSGTTGNWVTSDAVLAEGQIYFVELSWDSGSVATPPVIKLDGVALTVGGTNASGTYATDAARALIIGGKNDSNTFHFDGKIYEVRVYDNDGISDSILKELDGTETNLIMLLRFEQGTGTTVYDQSTKSNNGTITAGTGVWGVAPTAGNAGGLLQVRIEDEGSDAWVGSQVLYLATRSGERRADSLLTQAFTSATELVDPSTTPNTTFSSGTTGGSTSNASGGASSHMTWTADGATEMDIGRTDAGYATYTISGASLPRGLFRVLVRVKITTDIVDGDLNLTEMALALGWSHGGKTKTPVAADEVDNPVDGQGWFTYDLGEISIPVFAVPDGFTPPDLDIRIHTIFNNTSTVTWGNTDVFVFSFDFIQLIPVDEGAVIVNAVSASDEVLADLISDPPGVWLLNTSSVSQQFANFNGAPIRLTPEASRIYWHKADTDDPTLTVAYMYLKYTPLVMGL